MANTKYNAKPTANWERNMSKVGTPARSSSAKPAASKATANKPAASKSSTSTVKKPSTSTTQSNKTQYPSPQSAPLPKGNALTDKKVTSKAYAPKPSASKSTSASKSSTTGKIVKGVIDRANKYPSSSSKPTTTKPTTTKPSSSAKPSTSSTKPAASSNKTKPAAGKTVSQLWKEKTGLDWSEAKKRGLSDGSAKSNLALMAKLKSGAMTRAELGAKSEVNKLEPKKVESVSSSSSEKATPKMTSTGGSGMGAMEKENSTYKRGGSVKKKKK
jgi:hypothetical protein